MAKKPDQDQQPLGPFGEMLEGDWDPVEMAEIHKAIANLPQKKAPGADALPAEIYKHIPSLRPYIQEVCNRVIRTGHFPKALRRILVIPILKEAKDAHLANSRRPISLICTMVKIVENRIECYRS